MRSLQVLSVLVEFFIFHKFNRHSKKILGKRIKEACEKLGTTYIKFGQMLSTRYDIMSVEDCKELQKLLDDINPMPYEKIREIFRHDLGKYPEEIFDEFSPKPIASASISQVYKAKLKDDIVAVKVRRPYVGKQIERDMDLLIKFVRFAQFFSRFLWRLKASKIIKEMKSWLLDEIDFEKELKNIIDIKKYYSFCDNRVYTKGVASGEFLHPYPRLCSKNIITMNFIEGVPLSKLHLIKDNPEYDVFLSLKSFLSATVHAFFHKKGEYLFQGDPHPANILILKNGRSASIDCGLTGRISTANLKNMKKLFLATYSGNVENTIKASLDLSNVSYKKYAPKIRKDIQDYLSKTPDEGIGFWFMEVVKICVKHKVPVPHFLSAFGRCNFVLEGSIKSFDPSITTLDLIEHELKYSMRKQIINNLKGIKYEELIYSLSEKAKNSPEVIHSFIERFSQDPVKFIKDIKKAVI